MFSSNDISKVKGNHDEAILVLANRQPFQRSHLHVLTSSMVTFTCATIIYSRVKLFFMMDRGRNHWGFYSLGL